MEALAAIENAPPDMIISDVMMPEMTGIELALCVTKVCPTCKILLFSGQAATADLLESARSQGHNFTLLSKPVHPSDLLKAMREALGGAGALWNPMSAACF